MAGRELSPKQLAALRKGRAVRKANLKAAGKAKRKSKPKARPKAKPKAKSAPRAKRAALSPQEREGMGLIADLVNAQFGASGLLAHGSAWLRGLSDAQRNALIAADRRVRKAAGR